MSAARRNQRAGGAGSPEAAPGSPRLLQVRVKPGARESSLAGRPDGTWLAKLKSAPIDGRANAELIGLIAAHFGLPRKAVTIRRGASSRTKYIKVEEAL